MRLFEKTVRSWPIDRMCPALLFGLLLAAVDYIMNALMDYFGQAASKTILHDLASGFLGGAAAFFFLTARCQKCMFENAKERVNLIGNLNRGIRGALGAAAESALSDDRTARLRGLDEASDRIDTFLCELAIAPASASGRLSMWLKRERQAPRLQKQLSGNGQSLA